MVFVQAIHTPVLLKLAAPGLNARDMTNIVQLFDEPTKGPGAVITFPILPQLNGSGTLGDAPISGQETALSWQVSTFTINQQRNASLIVGKMSQQRVPWSLRDAAYAQLASWVKVILDCGLLNQAACNTNQANVGYTAMNTPPTLDSAHQILAGGAANEAALTAQDVMDLEYVVEAVTKAQGTLLFPIKPPVIKGIEIAGMMFVHPNQARDMKNNYQAGEWGDIMRAAMQGGQVTGNPIFTGALMTYENCVLHVDAHVPWGDATQNLMMLANGTVVPKPTVLGVTSVARAVFLGAQALCIAFGAADNVEGRPLRFRWYEEILDGGNQLRVTGGLIWGAAQPVVSVNGASQLYAGIVVSTYAAP
jgi:N4-gp56 family major capsid protein